MRVSSYLNHVDIGDGTSLLYNGATLCIDVVPTPWTKQLAEGNDFSFLAPEEMEHLVKRGHLTRLSCQRERAAFRRQARLILKEHLRLNRKPKRATLSFILTYNCNLSCGYCYQKSLAKKSAGSGMTGEFVDQFLSRYLPQLFRGVPKKNILFLLFGGEPLLPANRDVIGRILAYAKTHSITVSSPTNATTLPAMADLIGPGKIGNVQVTLDGDQTFHDSQRIPSSGKPTFDAMIAAIRQLIERKAYIFLRIHIHPGKLDSTRRLIEYLEKEKILGHPNVDIYFAPINTFHPGKGSAEDFDIFYEIFQQVATKTKRPPSLNLDFLNTILGMQSKKMLPKIRFCSLGAETARIVDSRGDIYDCYEEAGHPDRRIGTVADGKLKFFPLKKTYSKRHVLNIPECLQCSVALFCGGGCARQALIQKGSMFAPYCLQNREFIAQTLKAYYLNKSVGPSSPAPC